jgi:ATP-dependent Lon protease
VIDQLMRIDQRYAAVRFSFTSRDGHEHLVQTLEEEQYPKIYHKGGLPEEGQSLAGSVEPVITPSIQNPESKIENPQEGHVEIKENQKGVSFDKLFGPYLRGSSKIVVTDAYIRSFHQAKNLMDFLETVFKTMDEAGDMEVHLITCQDEFRVDQQEDFFTQMQKNCIRVGIKFTWEYDSTIHARHIVTDHGWKILLDRGLDVFQPFDSKDAFSLAARLQSQRLCKKFEVTYLRV